MKTYAKLFSAGIMLCLCLIYLMTLPGAHESALILRPTLEPKTDFIVPDHHRVKHDTINRTRDDLSEKQSKSSVRGNDNNNNNNNNINNSGRRIVQDSNDSSGLSLLYTDPYLNVKYRFVEDTVQRPFDEKSFISGAAHADDPMKLNSFDQEQSDAIGGHRDIIESRHHSCRSHDSWDNLPSTSIIMTFYNEAR